MANHISKSSVPSRTMEPRSIAIARCRTRAGLKSGNLLVRMFPSTGEEFTADCSMNQRIRYLMKERPAHLFKLAYLAPERGCRYPPWAMGTVRWLHLSNLCLGAQSLGEQTPELWEAFLRDLADLRELMEPWNLVFVTGSLTKEGSISHFGS